MNLAFGELSDDQALLAEQDVRHDPESARTLRAYRSMRADMKLLNNIPESQLSTERLRRAILEGGLKPKRDYGRWNWLLVPLATGVAALAITTMIKRSNLPNSGHAPNIVMNQSTLTPPESSESAFQFEVPKPHVSFGTAPGIGEANLDTAISFGSNDAPEAASAPAPRERAHVALRGASKQLIATVSSAPAAGRAAAPQLKPAGPAASMPAAELSAVRIPQDTSADDNAPTNASKIVVVDSTNDSDTGARPATEVGSSTDVVVGG